MKSVLIGSVIAVTLSAATTPLMKEALNAGLKPIPTNKKELMKLIDNPQNPITKAKVKLGKELYFDPRLSKSERVSCDTCHNLAMAGIDGLTVSTGYLARHNPHHLNSPTVYNAVFFKRQFWDGRAKNLESQAQGPMQASFEMAATPQHVVDVVKSIPQYVKEFKKAYGNKPITFALIADTIASFERTLVTPAPYDKFLHGNSHALSKVQKEGLQLFLKKGCVSCHSGIALGGEMQPFGIYAKYKYENIGDFKGDKNGLVKVPTLRNITKTAPYFHNGMIKTLKGAIQEMGRIQLGIKISDKEAYKIEQFFKSLNGKMPRVYVPQLPVSTLKTPAPSFEK
jgi:cytochrome c peroxidase